MKHDRRFVLCGLAGLPLTGLTLSLSQNTLTDQQPTSSPQSTFQRFSQRGGDFSWTPHPLNPAECAPVAYDGFWHNLNACGYGAFYSIVGMMAEKYGAPYDQFPFSMLAVNEGGVIGWGTICGALYGAAAAFALFWNREECAPMVNELFRWYETTSLPVYDPGPAAKGVAGALPATAPGSVLCHVSVSTWCHAFNMRANSLELGERCARLTADVARKAIEIFNAKIAQGVSYQGIIPPRSAVAQCSACHAASKKADIQKGQMNCTPCHGGNPHLTDKFNNHP